MVFVRGRALVPENPLPALAAVAGAVHQEGGRVALSSFIHLVHEPCSSLHPPYCRMDRVFEDATARAAGAPEGRVPH